MDPKRTEVAAALLFSKCLKLDSKTNTILVNKAGGLVLADQIRF